MGSKEAQLRVQAAERWALLRAGDGAGPEGDLQTGSRRGRSSPAAAGPWQHNSEDKRWSPGLQSQPGKGTCRQAPGGAAPAPLLQAPGSTLCRQAVVPGAPEPAQSRGQSCGFYHIERNKNKNKMSP